MCKRCKNKYDDFNHCDNCNKFFKDPESSLFFTLSDQGNELRACEKCCKKLDKNLKKYGYE
jgi:hypothetical protein